VAAAGLRNGTGLPPEDFKSRSAYSPRARGPPLCLRLALAHRGAKRKQFSDTGEIGHVHETSPVELPIEEVTGGFLRASGYQ